MDQTRSVSMSGLDPSENAPVAAGNQRSDEQLMAAYQRGDLDAFQELFARYSGNLRRMLARDLRPATLAEDLLQQTFLQLHRARFDFDPAQSFAPWIYTIAMNLKREYFRSRQRRPEVFDSRSQAEAGGPAADQQRVDARQTVSWALRQIPGDQRDVIELHWFQGLSFPEVAACLGIGAVAAKVRAHRGYTLLRALLGRDEAKVHGNQRGERDV